MPDLKDRNTAHDAWLEHAIALSRQHMQANDGGPFGAVIVRNDQLIAEGYNCVTSSFDPTAHAEIVAIRRACEKLQSFDLSGCVLYSSCEPCPMCLGATYWSRVDALYFANTRHDAAAINFDDALIYRELQLDPHARKLPTFHRPHPNAKAVFDEWMNKSDKIRY